MVLVKTYYLIVLPVDINETGDVVKEGVSLLRQENENIQLLECEVRLAKKGMLRYLCRQAAFFTIIIIV